MSNRRYAFIPVVQLSQGGVPPPLPVEREHTACLIEVYSQLYVFRDDDNALVKGLDPVAAPLRKVGLYQAGCSAVSAVRKLGLKRPRAAFYQLLKHHLWIEGQRLHTASSQGPTEGHSAELGLALAILMNASDTRRQCVLATGAFSNNPPSDRGSQEAWRPYDVKVWPVGSLPEKLRQVIQYIREKGLPDTADNKELLFFTPTHFERDGVPTKVGALPEVQELSRLGVKVVPVAWLSEAARELNAHRTRYLLLDRLLQLIVGGLTAFGLLWVGWLGWCTELIPMVYLPAGPSAPVAEPFIVCFTRTGGYYPLPLHQEGVGHTIPVNTTLGWKIRVGDATSSLAKLSSWLGYKGYYVAQVIIAEFSPAKVMTPQLNSEGQALRIAPGGIWEWAWELNDRAEINGLVLLARRQAPFNADDLRRHLLERFPQAGGSTDTRLDVMAAVNFMSTQAPGVAKFIFQTVEAKPSCSESQR